MSDVTGITRTGCVWCPDWPVIAARIHADAIGADDVRGRPLIVRERIGSRDLVRAASTEARSAGVTRGMRRREAEARCPEAVCVDADEANEARTFEVVARAIEVFTPRVVLERPGRCEFSTRGPSRYFGGDDALAEQIRAGVAAALGPDGDDVRVGIADGVFVARLAARRSVVVPAGGSAEFVAPWPVSVLDDDDLAGLLVRLGLPTLGSVAALASDAVLARFGSEGRRIHELSRGIDPGPSVFVTPPPDLVERTELDPPAERVDIAAFAAKELADRLLERLAERGLACTRVLVVAETEHGERLTRCWRHTRSEYGDALTPGVLAERVRWQLDAWINTGETTAGITVLTLIPDEVVPADGRQLGFWGGDQVAHQRADRALARVQGIIGYEAVTTAVVQGGRTAAEQVRFVPWGEPREPERPLTTGSEVAAWPGALPPPFPARVFDPPLPAELVDARGDAVAVNGRGEQSRAPAHVRCRALPGGGGAVRAWAGPWAHDVRWWDPHAYHRCARWQLVVSADEAQRSGARGSRRGADEAQRSGARGSRRDDVACIVVVEGGRAGVEAIYD
ncbi:MAG: protein ImuB [Actinomycetota bacterium]|jgi:protein ImuB|nr:protein ImuB [Actinomycetota bacterium]